MITSRAAPILFAFIVSGLMSCDVSGVSTFSAISEMGNFFEAWMLAWAKSWAVAFPVILIVVPLARKLVTKITTT